MITIKHLLDQLGMVGLMAVIVIWGCAALWLGGPFVGQFAPGLFAPFLPSPLANLNCPLTLSLSDTKTITATIANPRNTEQTYLVTMAQQPPISSISSGGSIELCHQDVTVPPSSEKTASCLVRLDDLGWNKSEESWYMSVDIINHPVGLPHYSGSTDRLGCIIRSKSSFQGALAYSGAVMLSALALILWGAFLWPRSKWVDRILTVLLSIVVYALAWLMNSMVWVGLSHLHLFFLVIAGMLLVMFMVLWLVH